MLQRIYNDEDDVDDPAATVEPTRGGIMPLAPSERDKGKGLAGTDF